MKREARELRERFIISGPDANQLLLAARVVVSTIVAALALEIGTSALHGSSKTILYGALVAMFSSLSIADARPRTTWLLAPIPGIVGATLGTIFASQMALANLAFLAVIFAAVAVRARGPRWTAWGTIMMIACFLALFFATALAQLAQLMLAVVVGVAGGYVGRFVVFPDRPRWIARTMLRTFAGNVRLVVAYAQDLAARGTTARRRRRLHRALRQLNANANAIEARLESGAPRELGDILDAELAAEDLAAGTLWRSRLEPPASRRLRGASARARIEATLVRVEAATAALARSDAPLVAPAVQQPALRQAVQLTLGAAVAIAVGYRVSPQHYFWAVLATYFVFNGTASSGETLARAWTRTLGTAIGGAIGFVLGFFVKGRVDIAETLLFIALFLGVYVIRMSYTLMTAFLMISFALFYVTLGLFSDGVLGVRLVEIAIGSLCGGSAATFVLPTRTRDVVRGQARATLEAVGAAVHASIARLLDPRSPLDPLVAARALESSVIAFATRAKPGIDTYRFSKSGRDYRRWAILFAICSYHGRSLCRLVERLPREPTADIRAVLGELDAACSTSVHLALARLEIGGAGGPDTPRDHKSVTCCELVERLRRSTGTAGRATELDALAYHLERIGNAVARIARA